MARLCTFFIRAVDITKAVKSGKNHTPFSSEKTIEHFEGFDETCLDGITEEQLKYDYHRYWATILLVPFLLNYLSGWYIWYQLDERKAYTWPVPLVALYLQMRAGMIIKELWKNPKRGLIKKRQFERDMNEAEVFLEAIPTSFILGYIQGSGIPGANFIDQHHYDWMGLGTWHKNQLQGATQLNSYPTLFVIVYSTSIVSASLGLANTLKVGKWLHFRKPCKAKNWLRWEFARCCQKEVVWTDCSRRDLSLSSSPASSRSSARSILFRVFISLLVQKQC